MAGLQAELSFLSGPYRLAAFAKSSRGDPCSRDPLSSLAGLCSKLCSAGSWSPVVILPCCLSRGPQGICVGHGRGKIVTSPAGVHTIPGWPDDPSLHRVRVPSTHLGLQVRKKKWASSFSLASCREQQLASFPRACGRQEGEPKDWKLFGLSVTPTFWQALKRLQHSSKRAF